MSSRSGAARRGSALRVENSLEVRTHSQTQFASVTVGISSVRVTFCRNTWNVTLKSPRRKTDDEFSRNLLSLPRFASSLVSTRLNST